MMRFLSEEAGYIRQSASQLVRRHGGDTVSTTGMSSRIIATCVRERKANVYVVAFIQRQAALWALLRHSLEI